MFARDARRAGLFAATSALAVASACTHFEDAPAPSPLDDGGVDADAGTTAADGSAVPTTKELTYIATRTTRGTSGKSILVPPPAGVRPGDLLVAFWGSGTNEPSQTPPDRWDQLGSSLVGDPSQRTGFWWLGDHVLSADEGEDSRFVFADPNATGDVAVTLTAFRGARANQPVAPAYFQRSSGTVSGNGFLHLAPPLLTTAQSRVLFVFATAGVTTPPLIDGADRFDPIEATDSITLFLGADLVPPRTSVPRGFVKLDMNVSSNQSIGVGTLAVVQAE
jgi:hypothetical protein